MATAFTATVSTPAVPPSRLLLRPSQRISRGSTLEAVRLFGDIEAGDSYTLTLDDQDVTYTAVAGDTMTDVREQLVSAVNGAGLDVTATTGGGVNEVILSAGEGTSFALTATATDAGTLSDNAVQTVTLGSASVTQETFNAEIVVSGTAKLAHRSTAMTAMTF